MKKILFFAIPLAMVCSCSVEENVAQEPKWDKEAYAQAIMEAWKNLDIDFSKLFDYNTSQIAAKETERAFAFITTDIQDELAKRPDCDHAMLSFHLYQGKASLGAAYFADSDKGVFRECFAFQDFGIRLYTYFINDPNFYAKHIEMDKERCIALASDSDRGENKITSFISDKLRTPDGVAEFKVYVDATSSKLYGYR